jgi:hypothetical protein
VVESSWQKSKQKDFVPLGLKIDVPSISRAHSCNHQSTTCSLNCRSCNHNLQTLGDARIRREQLGEILRACKSFVRWFFFFNNEKQIRRVSIIARLGRTRIGRFVRIISDASSISDDACGPLCWAIDWGFRATVRKRKQKNEFATTMIHR